MARQMVHEAFVEKQKCDGNKYLEFGVHYQC